MRKLDYYCGISIIDGGKVQDIYNRHDVYIIKNVQKRSHPPPHSID